MGSTSRDEHIRPNRRPQPPTSDSVTMDNFFVSTSSSNLVDVQLGFNESGQNPNLNPIDDGDQGYCTEEQLEKLLLNKLDVLYDKAISKIVALGYDREIALGAILTHGHCYGGMDALTNIFNNSMAYFNSPVRANNFGLKEKQVFTNLKQFRDFSLCCLVCLLQHARPCLTKGDAMRYLLMSELNLRRASKMELNVAPNPNGDSESSGPVMNNMENVNNDSIGVTPSSCRFHGGWGYGNRGTSDFQENRSVRKAASEVASKREFECPKWSNLSPTMKFVLKNNVAAFAAEYRASLKKRQIEEIPLEETESIKSQEGVNMMLKKFHDLNLEGDIKFVPEDQKDKMIFSLVKEIKDLEKKVKERKEWAHQKAMQAARKLSHDLTELKILKMEREEIQQVKQSKPSAEDPTMKRLSRMENAFRKTSGQLDCANVAVKILETENAELRAGLEASKLSASESMRKCLEVAKRENKHLKRLLAWEKQRAKLQEGIAAEKQKIIDVREEMRQVEEAKKTAEAKWRQEQKAKALTLAQIEEEKRLKESTESTNKRNLESLRSKIKLDLQRHKDDLQRIEQELTHRKSSTNLANHPPNPPAPNGPYGSDLGQPISTLHELDDSETGTDRECIICSKDEASVIFLPCAHQVLCANCNDENVKNGKVECLICKVPIEQRVRVFGACS